MKERKNKIETQNEKEREKFLILKSIKSTPFIYYKLSTKGRDTILSITKE